MSIKEIRDLFDQADVHLKVLEDHEHEFAKLAEIPMDGPRIEFHRGEATRRVARARQETLSVRLGDLVRLQGKLEKACETVASEVQRVKAR